MDITAWGGGGGGGGGLAHCKMLLAAMLKGGCVKGIFPPFIPLLDPPMD